MNIQDGILGAVAFTAMQPPYENETVLPFNLADFDLRAPQEVITTPNPVKATPIVDLIDSIDTDESIDAASQVAFFYPFALPVIPTTITEAMPNSITPMAPQQTDQMLSSDALAIDKDDRTTRNAFDAPVAQQNAPISLQNLEPEKPMSVLPTLQSHPVKMNPSLVVPSEAGIDLDTGIDVTKTTEPRLRRNDTNNAYLQDAPLNPIPSLLSDEKVPAPVQATDALQSALKDAMTPFTTRESRAIEPNAPLSLVDEITRINEPSKTFFFDPPIRQTNDRSNVSNRQETDLNQTISIDKPKAPSTQTRAEYDVAIQHLSDFINKKINASEHVVGTQNPSTATRIPTNDIISDLQRSEYKAGDAGIALKIEPYTAKIKIHPADLGQVTAEINIDQGKTALTLTTESKHVTDLITLHLQALHEKFTDSNIHLSQVTLQQNDHQASQDRQSFAQQQQHQSSSGRVWGDGYHLDEEAPPPPDRASISDALVDTYA